MTALGLIFSPDYCYRTLKPNSSGNWIADYRDTLEIPKYGYTIGIIMLFKLNNRINLEIGLQFSNKGEKTKQWDLHPFQPDPAIPKKIKFTYSYLYLDIPIKINYNLMNKRFKVFISPGISTNIFIAYNSTSFLEYEDGNTGKISSTSFSGFTRVNIAILAGLGLDYGLTKNLNFRLEPIYRQSITSIIDAPIKAYLYSFGINTGIYYKLGH